MKHKFNYYLVVTAAESHFFGTRDEAENYIGELDEKIMTGEVSDNDVKFIRLFDKDGDLVVDCSYTE